MDAKKTTGAWREPETGKILKKIPRQDGTELRLALREYEGHPWIDLRSWTQLGHGGFVPKMGVSIKTRELREVIDGLGEALVELEARSRQGNKRK